MVVLLWIFTIVTVTLLYMWGGQEKKWIRRFLSPLVIYINTLVNDLYIKKRKKTALREVQRGSLLLLMAILSAGYGEKSAIYRWCGRKDWLTRIAYGGLVSIPFIIFNPTYWYTPILVGAYSVRAGSLGRIGKYDILIEDIVRGLGLSACLMLAVA